MLEWVELVNHVEGEGGGEDEGGEGVGEVSRREGGGGEGGGEGEGEGVEEEGEEGRRWR